jgi:shikimate kinase
MVYYIGGASASGKSTVAKRLSENAGLALIELDELFNAVEASVDSKNTAISVMNNVADVLVRQLLAANISCIVEGGWLLPEAANGIAVKYPHFRAVYCAYQYSLAAARLELLRRDGKHWLAHEEEETALAFLCKEISPWYATECKRLNLAFFDFSEIDKGVQMLEEDFEEWLDGPSSPRRPKWPFGDAFFND